MASQSADGNGPYDYFRRGAEVEVSSNDDGFRGSWYLGTIVRQAKAPLKGSSKVLVEYKTLMDDRDPTRPLTEVLELVLLRPPPPQEHGAIKFKLNDEVDAYYTDGWWEGVVTDVDEERDRYSVFFRTSKEQFVFEASQLRLHREWVGGDWIPPLEMEADATDEKLSPAPEVEAKKDTVESYFSPGALVEIQGQEEGFEGSWYPATVVEKTENDKYLVVYETLRNDDDTDFSREEIDSLHLRPRPPNVGWVGRFKARQKIDAEYNDGWWEGEIMKVLKNNIYVVHFRNTGEKLKFNHMHLRAHQDLINGVWVVSSKAPK